ncbi:MAG: DNA mismatch repair protein MutS [Chlamydiae bacterium]|nr:DNA mismatch repair protein MutS [Chlamydiota bacterium]
MDNIETTPMMKQWHSCKQKAKDALVLFRLGDFYEAFYEDAKLMAKELSLTLTQRQKVPMCGVPAHTCDGYVDKLIAKGYKVAIAEQTEDPKVVKGLVKREIMRIISPATIINSSLIEDKNNNFFVSIYQQNDIFGLISLDLTTSYCSSIELENKKELLAELYKIKPKELLASQKFKKENSDILEEISSSFNFIINLKDEWYFDLELDEEKLKSHFKVHSLDSLGLKSKSPCISALGALFTYLNEDLGLNLNHIKKVSVDTLSGCMSIDYSCMKNLEIFEPLNNNKSTTLLELLDKTCTPMGARLLKQWLKYPLIEAEKIIERQDSIEELLKNHFSFLELQNFLEEIKDLQRLNMKVQSGFSSPKDLLALRKSLEVVPLIKKLLEGSKTLLLSEAVNNLLDLPELISLLKNALVDLPPFRISDGNIFKDGYNQELDEIRLISKDSKAWIANYQNELKEKTQIKTLKVGFTSVFGYYIEVSRGQADKIPSTFQRRQTLVNSERFVTEELKEFEHKVLSAEDRIKALEIRLYNELRIEVAKFSSEIEKIAGAIAIIDVLFSLAKCAKAFNYKRPLIDNLDEINIKRGRHPIIESSFSLGEFIPNDTLLDHKDNQLLLITGPNMAGKSTYIRQVALIIIMAQMGSFIPADFAKIGIIDKVFSRIGASDNLSKGQSTFMVEMIETANILNNATDKSLVILDEIGRGTSTYDGISIAWAVAEYLTTCQDKKAKTLFATHYFELTDLASKIKGISNYTVQVEENNSNVVFLRKIIKGLADKSYGIHVAKLAGLPEEVIKRAESLLLDLENAPRAKKSIELPTLPKESSQAKILLEELKKIDLNRLTPIDSLKILENLQKLCH